MKNLVAGSKKVKMTLNIDKGLLDVLKTQSKETDIPYQRLYMRQAINDSCTNEVQELKNIISKLAKEVEELKAKIA